MRFMQALALIAGLLTAPQAMAAYGGVTLGQDQTTPTATPVCVMYGTTCKAQIGTYNGNTGVWTLPSGFNLPGVGPLGAGIGPALGLAANANGGFPTVSVSATAPISPSLFQPWLNTTATPYVWNIWDGASWVALGTINATTHALVFPTLNLAATPSGGFGGVSGNLPIVNMPVIGANAILGNGTAGSATPTALSALPSTFTGTSGHVLPYLDGANAWSGTQTINNLVSTQFPGLSSNVEFTGVPGLDMSGCATVATCGWMLFSTPTSYPAAGTSLLRVQKMFPSVGGGVSGNVYNGAWFLGFTGENDAGYVWFNQSELHNRTKATTGAQNVAVAGTIIKELGSNPAGTQISPSWALYGECTDQTLVVDPTSSCLGAEIDTYGVVGSGTDAHKQRVGLQLNGGVNNGFDAGVHIGILLLMGTNNGAVIDNGIVTGAGTFGKFIDTTASTFTGNVLNLTNFSVDGSGNLISYGTVALGNTGAFALGVSGTATFGKSIIMNGATSGSLSIQSPATGSTVTTGAKAQARYFPAIIDGVSVNILTD